jgi:hypothetical protein
MARYTTKVDTISIGDDRSEDWIGVETEENVDVRACGERTWGKELGDAASVLPIEPPGER